MKKSLAASIVVVAMSATGLAARVQPDQIVHVDLAYRAPVAGQPSPNFSPKGTQVTLTDIASDALVLSHGKLALGTDAGVFTAAEGHGSTTAWSVGIWFGWVVRP